MRRTVVWLPGAILGVVMLAAPAVAQVSVAVGVGTPHVGASVVIGAPPVYGGYPYPVYPPPYPYYGAYYYPYGVPYGPVYYRARPGRYYKGRAPHYYGGPAPYYRRVPGPAYGYRSNVVARPSPAPAARYARGNGRGRGNGRR